MIYILLAGAAGLAIWFIVEKRRRRTHPVSGGLHRDITLPHEQEFELYGNAFSHCSRKTRIVFAELGLPYQHKPIDLIETGAYETLSPDYLKINPAGIVPTLVHNGHPVYESDDIMRYAAEQARPSAPSLVPEPPELRAEMQRWVDCGALSSDDPMGGMEKSAGACVPGLTLPLFMTAIRVIPLHRIAVGLLFHPDKKRPAFFIAAKLRGLKPMLQMPPIRMMIRVSRDNMARHLAAFERQLEASGGPWLLGERYTLADVSWSCVLLRLEETGWLDHFTDTQDLHEVIAYYRALKARPSWRRSITGLAHPLIERASADLRAAARDDRDVRAALYGD